MPIFRVSQAEKWHRLYTIEAQSLQEAKEIYEVYLETTIEPESMHIHDPEYLEDIEDDIEWTKDDGEDV